MNTGVDVVIIGAGMVGLSAALHLQERGLTVALFDPGREEGRASFGNAGVLSRNSIFPVAAPGLRSRLPRYALGRDVAVRARLASVPFLLPWLTRFVAASDERRWRAAAAALDPLVSRAYDEHLHLADRVGGRSLIRRNGWMRLYRSAEAFAASARERAVLAEYGVGMECLEQQDIVQLEPHLARRFARAILFTDSGAVESPGALVRLYRAAVAAQGGRFVEALAERVEQDAEGIAVTGGATTIRGRFAVLAAGAWSAKLARTLGDRFPLAAERGYHRHFRLADGAELRRPVHDAAGGYVMSPMNGRVRVLSGVELARPDDPPDHRQIAAVTADAANTIPLGDPVEPAPWMGSRPSTPDGLPVIGVSKRRSRLIFAFGHGHIGFANGPLTGRIVAALVAGEAAPIPIGAFSPRRFGA